MTEKTKCFKCGKQLETGQVMQVILTAKFERIDEHVYHFHQLGHESVWHTNCPKEREVYEMSS